MSAVPTADPAGAPPVELVCLDMAGTTVLDDGSVLDAFTAAMTDAGVTPGSERFRSALDHVQRTMGQSKITVFTEIFAGEADPTARAARANRAFEQAYLESIARGRVAPVPGAADTIAALRDAGVKVCLTTGFSPATRDAVVRALGWGDTVDLVLSPADAGRGRPYPDMILTAVIRLGVSDVRRIAVAGDTTSDLLAGSRAGAGVVAGVLTGAHDRQELVQAPHTHILDSVADLPSVLSVTLASSPVP